jgi:hypothetical protein
MEKMDKGLTVPKWVLIYWPKIPQNLSAQFVCPSPKVWDFDEQSLHRVTVACASHHYQNDYQIQNEAKKTRIHTLEQFCNIE